MQTSFVLGAVVILSSKPEHCPIVPPQVSSQNDVEEPGTDSHPPIGRSKRIDWRDLAHGVRGGKLLTLGQIDWYQDPTSQCSYCQKYVPTHPQDPQKNRRVESDQVDQITLFRFEDRPNPCQHPLSHWRRRMFLICNLQLR